ERGSQRASDVDASPKCNRFFSPSPLRGGGWGEGFFSPDQNRTNSPHEESTMLSRRRFLQSSLLALSPTVPVFVAQTAGAVEKSTDQKVLVVVQLDGGNDALNT